jgi:HlyD family secretion protein
MDQKLAAAAAVDASEAGVSEAEAQAVSAEAQIEKAKADLVDAKAHVDVARADLERAEVFAAYTRITSPYDGVITLRTFHRGDFIRGADQTSVQPMLRVERTDVVRLVIYVPDTDVPLTQVGAETVTTIETLPGHRFEGKVSRIAVSEDQKTKTMRTEVDLPNDQQLLRNGMFGRTKLILRAGNSDAFTIPSTALVGSTKENKGTVFTVSDGVARKRSVTVNLDNGVFAEVRDGISANDFVIVGNNNSLADGVRVKATEVPSANTGKKSQE